MTILIILIGAIMVFAGGLFLFNPNRMRQFLAYCSQGKRIYFIGVLRLTIGIILLLAASQCRFSLFVAILGILAIISAVIVFSMKLDTAKDFLKWWSVRSNLVLRVLSLIAIAIGVLLIRSL